MDDQQISSIVTALGGLGNITSATNCMTRLRIVVADEKLVDESAIRKLPAVLGLVHDRQAYYEIVVGPGKAKSYAEEVRRMQETAGPAGAKPATVITDAKNDGSCASEPDQRPSRRERFNQFCKVLGGIFVPMIPGFIVSGICGSFAMIIQQLVPGYADNIVWGCLYNVLFLIQQSLLAYLAAWTGYRAAVQFGGTPILGGMLGMMTSMSNINDIATLLGLYNADSPLSSILVAGKGGVLAAIVGVFLLVKVEHFLDKRIPDVLKVIGTPLITMLVCAAFYVLIIMPTAGFAASYLCDAMDDVCMTDNALVRIAVGYVGAALFLPLVALGMHHGLVALYAIQLQSIGYVTLYPALCMAGAGQVGAALAIRHKAKKCGNEKVVAIADAGIPAGFLGIGEPLVYGLTLPMVKPFITAGIGAGFGGAFVMYMEVAATSWGPSGLLGLCVMDAGPAGMAASLGSYAIGLLISYVMGFIITNAVVKERDVVGLYRDDEPDAQLALTTDSHDDDDDGGGGSEHAAVPLQPVTPSPEAPPAESASGPTIAHGQPVALDGMILHAPTDGRLIAQKAIDDKTFREGYLGSCFGIEPCADVIFAPCNGVVALLTDTKHALVIETAQSNQVMVHVGLDTVRMEGAGFVPLVSVGDIVVVDEPLLNFDTALIRERGYNATVITSLLESS